MHFIGRGNVLLFKKKIIGPALRFLMPNQSFKASVVHEQDTFPFPKIILLISMLW